MGCFSWKTQNTNRSISNRYSDIPTFPVVMIDNNNRCWLETNYEGYGEFGGKDFYILLAEMNGLRTREEGLDLAFGKEPYLSPNLYEVRPAFIFKWKNEIPESCEFQGCFYEF